MTHFEEQELRRRIADLETFKRESTQRMRDEINAALSKLQGTDGIDVRYPVVSGSRLDEKIRDVSSGGIVRNIYYTSGGQLVLGRFQMK